MKIILNIIIKEFLQLKRDPRLLALVFFSPVIQLVLLGYAATLDVNNVSTAVFDQDKTITSRDFIEKFQRSGYFSIDSYVDDYKSVVNQIDKGKVLWALVIPNDFEKKIKRGRDSKNSGII